MFERILKNFYLWERMFWTKKSLFLPYYRLYRNWDFPSKRERLGYAVHCKSLKEVNRKSKEAEKIRLEYLKKIGGKKTLLLSKEIEKMLQDNNFGQEWFLTIADFLISGWLQPPKYNLNISEKGKAGMKRIVLELNPDTSQNDIKEAWPWIKEKQKEAWPDFKTKYYTKKSFKILEFFMKARELKAEGKIDIEITTDLYPEDAENMSSKETDERRRARLRQIRKRMK